MDLAGCPGWARWFTLAALLFFSTSNSFSAPTLRGSPAAMAQQYQTARQHSFTFLETPANVRRYLERGLLVPLAGDENYSVAPFVSFPYARPQVRTFIERLSAQYREATGEELVVTSLTRPRSRQPANASRRSVHPTGMAVDLRVSSNPEAVKWLETTLLQLEGSGVINAIRENRPPHYHVAVYPEQYEAYVAALPVQTEPASEVPPEAVAAAGISSFREEAASTTLPFTMRLGLALANLIHRFSKTWFG